MIIKKVTSNMRKLAKVEESKPRSLSSVPNNLVMQPHVDAALTISSHALLMPWEVVANPRPTC